MKYTSFHYLAHYSMMMIDKIYVCPTMISMIEGLSLPNFIFVPT